MSAPTLKYLASRSGPVDAKQREQIRAWLDDDWESHDIDWDAVRLIRRLLDALEAKS